MPTSQQYTQIRGSIVVSISACHAEDPGSIPGRGVLKFATQNYFQCYPYHNGINPIQGTNVLLLAMLLRPATDVAEA